MSDKRRAEIEAKRAKLADLRKARADRQKAETERRAAEVSPDQFSCILQGLCIRQPTGPTPARRDIDELVNSLVGSTSRGGSDNGDFTPSSPTPGTPTLGLSVSLPGPSARSIPGSGRASRQSDFSSDRTSFGKSSNAATDHVIER